MAIVEYYGKGIKSNIHLQSLVFLCCRTLAHVFDISSHLGNNMISCKDPAEQKVTYLHMK